MQPTVLSEHQRLLLWQRQRINRAIKKRERKGRTEKVRLAVGLTVPLRDRGSDFSSSNSLCKRELEHTLWNFKHRLKKKDDRTYAMMQRLGCIVVGCFYETDYAYHGTLEFCSKKPGGVKVVKKPSFFATRLIIKQILHCRTNANKKIIARIINHD
jgi:hypothetical protein